MISNLLTPSMIKWGFLWSSWRKENAKNSVSTQPLPAVCSCPLKTLPTFSTCENYSFWALMFCCLPPTKPEEILLICSDIPRDGFLGVGAPWVFIWVSLMLLRPFREGSEPGCEIMQFPETQEGRDTQVSKQNRIGSMLQLSSGSGSILHSEPFVFPFRSNTGQPGLPFFTLVRKI